MASSSRSWKYNVFLSFRGEDTRKTYVDHLYSALVEKEIRTYKDDGTLPRGDSISPSLLKAIEESQIAVIIFSENYANSSWCLDELEYIMKCRDGRGQIVIPIFYKVDPSDVRKLKGKFGRAFAKGKQKNVKKTELWRKTLFDASNIAGWEPTHIANGHESIGIKKVVDTILDKLFSINSDVNEDHVGMGTRLQSLKSPDSHISNTSMSTPSRSWKYDVFLSFRGEDTRKTFVDHLYSALVDRLIRTYRDDEKLPRGDSFRPSLLEAIQESQIAVIIFSENYANSSWCLDELEYIMKCRIWRGQIVIPIFYNVEPSEVRKLEGNFGRAFAKRKRDNITKEELWKTALVDASNIAGWEPKHIASGHESIGIKKIVDTIFHKLFPLLSDVNEDLVGMGTRLRTLKLQLDIESGGVHMVGIWGVGGSGKTTLAYSAYKNISHHFDAHCFIDNIREKSKKLGELQEKVLSTLLKADVKVQSVEEGKDMIRSRFSHSNVLIVLDDVDDDNQIEALAGSHKWFGDGSRIIITTRDEHLLKKDKVKISHASLLSHDEAIQLFYRHVVQEDKPVEDYNILSECMVSYAGGLPLALKVLGSFLRGKDKNEWQSTLAKVKDIPNPTIMDKLKISYDGLEPNEKELFLDIACFFRRTLSVEKATMILDASGFHPGIGIRVLRQKALITISNGKFDMHDLVQEMGHHIIRGQHPRNPERHSRVWNFEEIEGLCSMDTTKENDKIEAISFLGDSSGFPKLVSNMKKLRFLNYSFNYSCFNHKNLSHMEVLQENDKIESISCVDGSSCFPKLVSNMKKLRFLNYKKRSHNVEGPSFLSNELRYICYHHYPGPFPATFQPKNLVVLQLPYSLQKELWQGYKHLPHLKELYLKRAKNLLRTPDFDGLPCLEKLSLDCCESLEEIHPSLGTHKSLVDLFVYDCKKLRTFPTIVCMKKLETLKIEHCEALLEFPEIQGSMDSLVYLTLVKVGIEVFPSSIGKYCMSLTTLEVEECEYLESIEGNFQALKQLQRVQFISVNYLSKDLSFPRFLMKLNISRCGLKDGEIPCDVGELFNLTELDLSRNRFTRLHFSLLQLTRLKELDLRRCEKLLELPELPSSVATLIAYGCISLESIGDFYTNCKCLSQVLLFGSGKKVTGAQRLLQSMLYGKAIENHCMCLQVDGLEIPKMFVAHLFRGRTCRLKLPENWCNDFCGFLMCFVSTRSQRWRPRISVKHEQGGTMGMDPEPGFWKECDDDKHTCVGYVSFGSLRHTTWWDSTNNAVSFSVTDWDGCSGIGVILVSRKNESGLTETSQDSSEFCDEKEDHMMNFMILHDTKSALVIC